jgi:hypothetical protein
MLTTFQEVDMGPLMEMRNKHKEEFEKKHGVKLGFMSAFVKVSFLCQHAAPGRGVVDLGSESDGEVGDVRLQGDLSLLPVLSSREGAGLVLLLQDF